MLVCVTGGMLRLGKFDTATYKGYVHFVSQILSG